jgi:hypothetical protein
MTVTTCTDLYARNSLYKYLNVKTRDMVRARVLHIGSRSIPYSSAEENRKQIDAVPRQTYFPALNIESVYTLYHN